MYNFQRIGKLLLFHLVFYAILAALFAAMMAVFLKTLKEVSPKWQLDESLIGSNPALSWRPRPSFGGTIIKYQMGDNFTTRYWIKQIDQFLEPYYANKDTKKVMRCDPQQGPKDGYVCDFLLSEHWIPCTKEYGYGYSPDSNGPCIFLKLNKIFGWVPEIYNSTNLPPEMSLSLSSRIKIKEKSGKHGMVWVECKEIDEDEDSPNIEFVNYFPEHGFPIHYFPYKNIEGYLSPVVIVHFEKPKRGTLIEIECRAWASNIYGKPNDWRNLVRLQLFVDEPHNEVYNN